MSHARSFCPRCGEATDASASDRPGQLRGLCRACFLAEHALVDIPERIEFERCNGCGSIELDGEWVDTSADLPELAIEQVTDAVEVSIFAEVLHWEATPEMLDETTVQVTCSFDLAIENAVEQREHVVIVAFEPTTCTRCGRIHRDDFASVVQLRAADRTPDEDERTKARSLTGSVIEHRVEVGDRDAYLTDVVERDEGIDFRLSTTTLGAQVARQLHTSLGGSHSTARTLVTTDGDGREVYRVTHVIRLDRYRPGDIVEIDGDIALIESVGDRIGYRPLTAHEPAEVNADTVDAEVLTTADAARSTTVVAILDDHAVQVIHPETYETVTVSRPPSLDADEATVDTVTVEGTVYILPPDR